MQKRRTKKPQIHSHRAEQHRIRMNPSVIHRRGLACQNRACSETSQTPRHQTPPGCVPHISTQGRSSNRTLVFVARIYQLSLPPPRTIDRTPGMPAVTQPTPYPFFRPFSPDAGSRTGSCNDHWPATPPCAARAAISIIRVGVTNGQLARRGHGNYV